MCRITVMVNEGGQQELQDMVTSLNKEHGRPGMDLASVSFNKRRKRLVAEVEIFHHYAITKDAADAMKTAEEKVRLLIN